MSAVVSGPVAELDAHPGMTPACGELVVPPERVVREENSAREQRPITRGGQRHRRGRELLPRQPGPDRGGYGTRDRPGEPEPVSGVQFRGALETLKVLPW